MRIAAPPAAIAAAFLLAAFSAAPVRAVGLWTAHLSGHDEVPDISTAAAGEATFTLDPGDSTLHYRIQVSDLDDPTSAHLHVGARGKNGEIVAVLRTPASGTHRTIIPGVQDSTARPDSLPEPGPGHRESMVSEGTIRASDLRGALAGRPLAELAALCDSGGIYLDVHSRAHPNGEIRGQLEKAAGVRSTVPER